MRSLATPAWPALAAALAVTVAGCGSTDISATKVAGMMRKTLTPAPQRVDCPDGLRPAAGATFDCEVVYPDGDTGQLTVHVLDSSGRVQAGPRDLRMLTISGGHVAAYMRALLKRSHIGLKEVRCPPVTDTREKAITCRIVDLTGLPAYAVAHVERAGVLAMNPLRDIKLDPAARAKAIRKAGQKR